METLFRSRGRTITTADTLIFSMITKDNADIHMDHEFVSRTVHKKPIAHGALTLAIACGSAAGYMPEQIPYGISSLLWRKPAFVGDTCYLEIVSAGADGQRKLHVVNQAGDVIIETSTYRVGNEHGR